MKRVDKFQGFIRNLRLTTTTLWPILSFKFLFFISHPETLWSIKQMHKPHQNRNTAMEPCKHSHLSLQKQIIWTEQYHIFLCIAEAIVTGLHFIPPNSSPLDPSSHSHRLTLHVEKAPYSSQNNISFLQRRTRLRDRASEIQCQKQLKY